MKGQGMWFGAIVVIAIVIAGLFVTGIWTLPGAIPPGCRIVKPVWGYYECELDPSPVSVEQQIFSTATSPETYVYLCAAQDAAVNAMQTPTGTYVTCIIDLYWASSSTAQADCQICSGATCRQQIVRGGESMYLDYGERADCNLLGPLIGYFEYKFKAQYKQKQLIYHDWYGYESETKGVGCDLRSVLSSTEWDMLPTNAKTSMEVGERQNFVVGWTDAVMIGNYFTHPTYGDVICTPQHQLYALDAYVVADEEGETGIYYDMGGNCYLIPAENPVASVECCPGEILQGYTCSSLGQWVPIDQGECCRGGICTAIHCPGGGGEYCDITAHRVHRYTCRSSDGACIDELNAYAACCPPDIGCAGDEYCDAVTYTCKKKQNQLLPCPFECCIAAYVDLTVYQEKHCSSGLMCCPDKRCKQDCGIPPPPDGGLEWVWIVIFAVLFGAIGYWKAEAIGAVIGGALGLMMGLVVWWFVTLAWWQQILLVIGGAALGGILAYFLLPVIIIAIAVAYAIVSK